METEEPGSLKLKLLEPFLQLAATLIYRGILLFEKCRPSIQRAKERSRPAWPYLGVAWQFLKKVWATGKYAVKSAVLTCRWFYKWVLNPTIKIIAVVSFLVVFPLAYLASWLVRSFLNWHTPRVHKGLCADQPLSLAYQKSLDWLLPRCGRPSGANMFHRCDLTIRWSSLGIFVLIVNGSVFYVFHSRSGLPDLDSLIRFEAPTTGHIYDENGETFIELAKEYRQVIEYKGIPKVMVQSIMSAEDKRFFDHDGLDYSAWPRVFFKFVTHTLSALNRQYDGEKKMWPIPFVFPQGGSTITQQLSRNYFLQKMMHEESKGTPHKFKRKIEEARVSLWMEEGLIARLEEEWNKQPHGENDEKPDFKRLAKEMILARYSSFVYMGNGRYGFAAGAEYLFGKELGSFNHNDVEKAALLAGIVKSPYDYAPRWDDENKQWVNLDRPRRRRNEILMLMMRRGHITELQYLAMQMKPLGLVKRPEMKTDAPAVVDHVLDELRSRKSLGSEFTRDQLYEGKIQVRTTANKKIQAIANEALEKGIRAYEDGVRGLRPAHPDAKGKVQGSVIVIRNRDKAVLTEVGGRRFYKDKYATFNDYNRVIDSKRQPGSAFKPFVYMAAILDGMDLYTTVLDSPIYVKMGGGGVHWIDNYDNKFKGAIPMRKALAESRNAATTWIWYRVGNDAMLQAARIAGITSKLRREPSTALGASEVSLMELAIGYSTLASGIVGKPYIIRDVLSSDGNVLYHGEGGPRAADIPADKLPIIQEGLRGVVRIPGGTAYWPLNGLMADGQRLIPVMGKTGTTTDFKDAIFCGSTYGPDGITICVRIGFDNPGMGYDEDGKWGLGPKRGLGNKETGGRTAVPVFKEIMIEIYRQNLAGPIPQFPEEIEKHIDEYNSGAKPDKEEESAPVTPAVTIPQQ